MFQKVSPTLRNKQKQYSAAAGETPKDVARRFGRLGCIAILGGDSGMAL